MAAKQSKKKDDKAAEPQGPPPTPRMLERFKQEILPAIAKELGRTNPHDLPRIQKIVVNMGVGSAIAEKKHLEDAAASLTLITGQKPLITKARKAISNFKLREGQEIGVKVTLRGARMYEFLDRLISLALPRVRDFRGLNPKAFDGNGNFNLGLSEQLVFPELNPDKFTRPQGLNISIAISGGNDQESLALLKAFGMPFRTEGASQAGAA